MLSRIALYPFPIVAPIFTTPFETRRSTSFSPPRTMPRQLHPGRQTAGFASELPPPSGLQLDLKAMLKSAAKRVTPLMLNPLLTPLPARTTFCRTNVRDAYTCPNPVPRDTEAKLQHILSHGVPGICPTGLPGCLYARYQPRHGESRLPGSTTTLKTSSISSI